MSHLDIFIIILFLIITLIVGVVAGRKVRSVKDYAIANKAYNTTPILLTLLATMIGGDDTTGDVAEFFTSGIIYALPYLGFIVSILIIAKYIAPKFDHRFEGMISVSDIIKYFYGSSVARVSGIVGTGATLGYAAAQNIALGHLVADCTGWSYQTSVIVSSSIVIFYTMFGGVRSVVITDVIQFSILIVMIPIICNVAVTHVGGVVNLIEKVPVSHISIFDRKDFYSYLALFFIWIVPLNSLFPPMIQRFLMTKNPKQISYISYVYAIIMVAMLMMMTCLALSALVLFPNISEKEVIPHTIKVLLPSGLRGLAVSGLIAVVMSTIDSNLNTGGILFAHNVLKSSGAKKIYMMRIYTLIIGVLALIIAVHDFNIIQLVVTVQAILSTGIGIPLFCAIMGLKVRKRDFWCCLGCSILSMVYNFGSLERTNYFSSLVMILSGCFGFFVSNLLKTEWVLEDGSNANFTTWLNSKKSSFFYHFKNIPGLIGRASAYPNKALAEYGANYVMFGIFSSINYIVPYFMWPHTIKCHYPLLISMRIIAGALCVGLLLKEYWPARLNKYFSGYWFFTLLYSLVFMPTVMFLLNSTIFEWLLNMALAVFMLSLLVDWVMFLSLLLIGVTCGYFVSWILLDTVIVFQDLHNTFLGLYLIVFSILIGLTFSRKRDFSVKNKMNFMKMCSGFMAHELKTPLFYLTVDNTAIKKIIDNGQVKYTPSECIVTYKRKEYDTLLKKIQSCPQHISDGNSMITHLLMWIRASFSAASKEKHSLFAVIKELVHNSPFKKNIVLKKSSDISFYGSKEFIEHTIYNIIWNAFKHAGNMTGIQVQIWIRDKILYIKDNGCGIDQKDIDNIFLPFYTSKINENFGLGLPFCKLVMENIGGDISCKSKKGKYTEFLLKFP